MNILEDSAAKNGAISVSEATNIIKLLLENQIGVVSILGEVSNFKPHFSGHRYFTLKDDKSQISCTMWKTRPLNFELSDGIKIVATGTITVYPPRGSYQLDIISLQPAGVGELYIAFEQLKQKLDTLGYFKPENKKTLPLAPKNIGVSTSPTGAAIKDIFSTIQRRFPFATIYFRPTIVQGEQAAPDIVKAIQELGKTPAEVLIVGRGGGSIEDLWAYNTELVANAIYKSKIPIISAVGHETDFTIADFVADTRAATPTAAAELATPIDIKKLEEILENYKLLMQQAIQNKINLSLEVLDEFITHKTTRRLLEKIRMNYQLVDLSEVSLSKNIKSLLQNKKIQIENLISRCNALEPLAPLERGFALLKSQNKIITKNESLINYKTFEIVRMNETVPAKLDIEPTQTELF